MKTAKRVTSVFFAAIVCLAVVLLGGMSIEANAATVASGKCGVNITWSLDSEGALTLSGTGAMYDYSFVDSNYPPWNLKRGEIKKLVLSEGITTIGNYAFYAFENLTTVDLPDSLKAIGDYSFVNCDDLQAVTFPEALARIGDVAFWDCDGIESIKITENVTEIGVRAFGDCSALNTISVKRANPVYSSLTGVLFNKNRTEIIHYPSDRQGDTYKVPASVTSVGPYSFFSANHLKEIVIPEGVTNIGKQAFYASVVLENVDLPDTLTSIGESAFMGCNGLESVTLPKGVTQLGDYLFYHCVSLAQVTFPNGMTAVTDGMFGSCFSLTQIQIPEGVTIIGKSAFDACTNLVSVSIPETVTVIDDRAFSACEKLKEVNLPQSVRSIGKYAFGRYDEMMDTCEGLEKIIFLNYECEISDSYATIAENSVIYGYVGSTAQAYARKYSRTFVELSCSHTDGHKYVTVKKANLEEDGEVASMCKKCGSVFAGSEQTIYAVSQIELSRTEYNYSGKVKTPKVAVADSHGNILTQGSDYTVTFETDRTSVGEHTVRIKFKGRYSGTKTLSFIILPKATSKLEVTQATKTLYIDWNKVIGADGYRVYVYKGSKQVFAKNTTKLTYKVTDLTPGTKYEVRIKAYVIIDGERVYAEKIKSVNTATKPLKVTLASVTAGTKKVTVKWYERNCTSYQIRYSTSKSFKTYETVKVTGEDSVTKTIKSLTSGKTYYFKIRAYKSVDGVKYYGNFSDVKSVTVK